MVIAITPGEQWDWIHESDRDEPQETQTVFVCRVLTSRQNSWVENHYAGSTSKKTKGRKNKDQEDRPDIEFRTGDYKRAAIIAGLVDVRNLRKPDGEVVPFVSRRMTIAGESLDVPLDSFLDSIPAEVLADLAGAITDGPGLREADRKN